jgi:transcriptional regulator with XRE-family HTH domain
MKTTTKTTAKKATAKPRPKASRGRVTLTPGAAVRVGRELQELTQAQLSALSGIPQSAISAIETGAVELGLERAERLARALQVHPAVLLWPNGSADFAQKRTG